MKNNTTTPKKTLAPVMQAYALGHKLRKNHPEPLEHGRDYTSAFRNPIFSPTASSISQSDIWWVITELSNQRDSESFALFCRRSNY